MGALENHATEEEWRFLSLRAHMACVICQIYIILCAREEGVKGRGKKWISQIRTWKITAESRGGRKSRAVMWNTTWWNCECVKWQAISSQHRILGCLISIWQNGHLGLNGRGQEQGRSGTCDDKVSRRRWLGQPRRLRRWLLVSTTVTQQPSPRNTQ